MAECTKTRAVTFGPRIVIRNAKVRTGKMYFRAWSGGNCLFNELKFSLLKKITFSKISK